MPSSGCNPPAGATNVQDYHIDPISGMPAWIDTELSAGSTNTTPVSRSCLPQTCGDNTHAAAFMAAEIAANPSYGGGNSASGSCGCGGGCGCGS